MNISQSIDDFMEYCQTNRGMTTRSLPQYENKLRVFQAYIFNKKRKEESSISLGVFKQIDIEELIKGLKEEDVFASLDYYIDVRQIEFASTARHYISVVKKYIVYLGENKNIKNQELLILFGYGDSSAENSFDMKKEKKIKALVNQKKLNNSKDTEGLNNNEYRNLIDKCDEIIDNIQVVKGELEKFKVSKENKNKNYGEYLKAHITKLLLITGIKFKILYDIKITDIDTNEGSIIINGFELKLPYKYYNQLLEYLDIRKEFNKENKDELFLDINGNKIDDNNFINSFIKKYILRTSSTIAISKFIIINMILKGINQSIIQDFTGYGDVVFRYCQEKVNEEKITDRDYYINKHIQELNLYTIPYYEL